MDALNPLSNPVLADEARFSDLHYGEWADQLDLNAEMFRMYAKPSHPWHVREHMGELLQPVAGRDVLDFGCGMGEEAVYLAKLGGRVTAMDISPKGIEITRARARHNGVTVNAFVGDVLHSGLPAQSFDLIHGLGILHHVGLEAGLEEVHRLLRPQGRAVFMEHMSNSRVIDKIRGLYNRDINYTEHERPLLWNEVIAAREKYVNERHDFRAFRARSFSLLARLRRPLPLFGRPWARKIDHRVLRMVPSIAHFAGLVVIYLER